MDLEKIVADFYDHGPEWPDGTQSIVFPSREEMLDALRRVRRETLEEVERKVADAIGESGSDHESVYHALRRVALCIHEMTKAFADEEGE